MATYDNMLYFDLKKKTQLGSIEAYFSIDLSLYGEGRIIV